MIWLKLQQKLQEVIVDWHMMLRINSGVNKQTSSKLVITKEYKSRYIVFPHKPTKG